MTYLEFIELCKQNPPDDNEYSETHHILPKEQGGNNNADNLIRLTLRNHLIAHFLFFYEHPDNVLMFRAIKIFGCEEIMMYITSHMCSIFEVPDELIELCCERRKQTLKDALKRKHGHEVELTGHGNNHRAGEKLYNYWQDYANKKGETGEFVKWLIDNNLEPSKETAKLYRKQGGILRRTKDVLAVLV